MIQFYRFLLTSLLSCFLAYAGADPMLEPEPLTAPALTSAPEASVLPDEYSARVPVTARTPEARTAAFENGLRQVYMHLTAHADLDRYPALKQSMTNATAWVDQYQYQQAGDTTYMLIRYNPDQVNRVLSEADLSVYTEVSAPLGSVAMLTEPSQITLIVTDLDNLEDYMRIDAYLDTLPGVTDAQAAEINIPTATFQLTITEPVSLFEETLISGHFLEPDHDSDNPSDASTLHYRYSPP